MPRAMISSELVFSCAYSWFFHLKHKQALQIENIELPEFFESFAELERVTDKFYSPILRDSSLWIRLWKNLELCRKHDVHLLSLNGEGEEPRIVSVLGDPGLLEKGGLAVVGSRRMGSDTGRWMELEIPNFLNQRPMTVISGGARGVDQKAHQIAIWQSHPTLCFTPSGIFKLYPSELKKWVDPILENNGALVSLFPPDEEMNRGSFHLRNRWIAGLADFILVVQAGRKSGSLMTAKHALDLGKRVGALPYFPHFLQGQGSNDLICDGAFVIRDHQDLISAIDQIIV